MRKLIHSHYFFYILAIIIAVALSSCGTSSQSFKGKSHSTAQGLCQYSPKKYKYTRVKRNYPNTKEARKSKEVRRRWTWYQFGAGNMFGKEK